MNKVAASIPELQHFLEGAGQSLRTFRYYNKREPAVIKNHLVTYLGMAGKEPIAYGHLDKDEAGKIWLGICVHWSQRGKGYGDEMMNWLMDYAREHLTEVHLGVDSDNQTAIRMYKRHGFVFASKVDQLEFYSWVNPTASARKTSERITCSSPTSCRNHSA